MVDFLSSPARRGVTGRPRNSDMKALPEALPAISLHHGSVMWVLAELGFQGNASFKTFNYYVKSLRSLGLPFAASERVGSGKLFTYSYEHLMELALALTLRVYGSIPDAVLTEITGYREELRKLYRAAYLQRSAGLGKPVKITGRNITLFARGMFLDLQLEYAGGKLLRFGPPRAISPAEALAEFAGGERLARPFGPIPLSHLSERVVALSMMAPLVKRGPSASRKHRTDGKPL
jgi:hypothetical protein